jgi:peptidoglycan/xylan/chitin deacetylase (PgdA/CDA1 family)
VKQVLALGGSSRPARGTTILIYHRVGADVPEELDVAVRDFADQLDVLADHDVIALDAALDRAEAGDDRPGVVLTFDDGFAELHRWAFPLLAERRLPFTLYLTTGGVDGEMTWEGATAQHPGRGLTWAQVEELHASGLCTVANHTRTHPEPHRITVDDVDAASDEIEVHLGVRPAHFAWPWGVEVPELRDELAGRFRSVATGEPGRLGPGGDASRLPRVPVRGSDPLRFFRAKLGAHLGPERAYAGMVSTAKRVLAR